MKHMRLAPISALLWSFAFFTPVYAQRFTEPTGAAAAVVPSSKGSIWHDPGDISTVNMAYGVGGPDIRPSGKFTFFEAATSGTAPKFKVIDSGGVTWIVKLGEESRSETAASRLLSAIGYYADDDYYLPEMTVEKLPKLKRGGRYISDGAIVHGARLERMYKERKYTGNWSWYKNPWTGTKEMNGLRVMMALMNNWDLKKDNNSVYNLADSESRYEVADLGATFGRTGNTFRRSKSNVEDYVHSKFIRRVTSEHVDFHMDSRPFFLTVFHLPNYITRTKMQSVAQRIPITHAKWVGGLLSRLTPQQLEDCFVSSGYSRSEAVKYSQLVRERITQLTRL